MAVTFLDNVFLRSFFVFICLSHTLDIFRNLAVAEPLYDMMGVHASNCILFMPIDSTIRICKIYDNYLALIFHLSCKT